MERHRPNRRLPLLGFATALVTLAVGLTAGTAFAAPEHEPNDSLESAGSIVLGGQVEGRIDRDGDEDHFMLRLDAPETLSVTVQNTTPSGAAPPCMADPSDVWRCTVTFDMPDAGVADAISDIERKPKSGPAELSLGAGDHHIIVRSIPWASATGVTYILRAARVEAPPAEEPSAPPRTWPKPPASFLSAWRKAETLYWQSRYLRAYQALERLAAQGGRLANPFARSWFSAIRVRAACQAGHGDQARSLAREAAAYVEEHRAELEQGARGRASYADVSNLERVFRSVALGNLPSTQNDSLAWWQVPGSSYFGDAIGKRREGGLPRASVLSLLGSRKSGYCPGDGRVVTLSIQDDRARRGGHVEVLVIGAKRPRTVIAKWYRNSRGLPLVSTDRATSRDQRAFVRAPQTPGSYRLGVSLASKPKYPIALAHTFRVR